MRFVLRLWFALIVAIPVSAHAHEWVAVVHGVSTGAYIAPKLRAKAQEMGIHLKLVHVQVGPITPEMIHTYNPDDYEVNIKFAAKDYDKAARALRFLGVQHSVIPGTEDGVMIADHLNEILGLPGNGTALTELKRNKEKLYQHLKAAGLNNAPFVGASSVEEGMSRYKPAGIEFPMIVKPVDDAGGHGFHKVNNPSELRAALETLFSPATTTVFSSKVNRVVIQAALTGPEVAVQGTVLNGEVMITDVIEYKKRNAVYLRDLLADPKSPLTLERIAVAEKVLKAVDIRNLAFHIEMIQDPRYGYVPIDVASRAMGGVDHLMVKECTGYNQIDAMVDSLLDPEKFLAEARRRRETGVPYEKFKSGCVLDFLQTRSGTVVNPPDVEFLRSLPTYQGHRTNLVPGAEVTVTTNMLNAGGVLWLAGEASQVEADERAFRAYESSGQFVRIECERLLAGNN